MKRFFLKLPLIAKLLILAFIPIAYAFFLSLELYKEQQLNINQIGHNLHQVRQSAIISRLIDQLQKERSISLDFVMLKSRTPELEAQRNVTDSLIQLLAIQHDGSLKGFRQYTFFEDIDTVRIRIDRGQYLSNQVMHFFSNAAFRLSTLNRPPVLQDQYYEEDMNDLVAQKLLSEISTYQGIIAGNIYNILFTDQYVIETLMGTRSAYDVYNLYEKELLAKAGPEILSAYGQLRSNGALGQVQQHFASIFSSFSIDTSMSYAAWKQLSMAALDEVKGLQEQLLQNAELKFEKLYRDEIREKQRTLIFLVVMIGLILFVTVYILASINKTLKEIRLAAIKLSEGKTGLHLHVPSKDAIGSLVHSINIIDRKNRQLAEAARQIGQGNFAADVAPRSKDDVLGNAIVQMKENLRQTLQELSSSREEFIRLADFIPQIVWTSDAEGNITYSNQKWFEIAGSRNARADQSWVPVMHPDDVGHTLAAWFESVDQKKVFEKEYRLRNAGTGEFRWYLGRAIPIFDEEGKLIKYFGTATDIHDQKRQHEKLEELVSQRTLELNRSNEDLQQFAHVASHDLKEPVRKIRTFSNRLASEFGALLPERGRIYLEKLENSAERMAGMIDSILNYSVVNATEQLEEEVDLNRVMEGILNDLELLVIQKNAQIRFRQLPVLRGAPALIYQLFYNLLNNALKFTVNERLPVIEITSTLTEAAQWKKVFEGKKAAHYFHIIVRDNGIGFRQEYADKMFQVFTRLNSREKFEGTGLGLALCKKIVHRHNGHIYALGREGEGAEIHIVLPAGDKDLTMRDKKKEEQGPTGKPPVSKDYWDRIAEDPAHGYITEEDEDEILNVDQEEGDNEAGDKNG